MYTPFFLFATCFIHVRFINVILHNKKSRERFLRISHMDDGSRSGTNTIKRHPRIFCVNVIS